jgi:hypothetical protein
MKLELIKMKKDDKYKARKRTIKPVEIPVEIVPLFPKEDFDFYVAMCKKTTISGVDAEMILALYRKYIQNIWGYTKNCNCSTGIGALWQALKEYFFANENKFEK